MRCPVCRATVETGPTCRRCKADLALLFAAEEERCRAARAAQSAVAGGDLRAALDFADRADRLRPDDDTRRLRAVMALLRRDFSGAWQAYRRLSGRNRPDR